jgi:chromate reductase, NAD(P)H dehydrogenase (quinone)
MEQHSYVVLGISGSLRKQSSNTRLLLSLEGLLPAGTDFRQYDGLAGLPHFSPDLDSDEAEPDEAVQEWRLQLREADAIVICTPEYARGVPGSLKNALDWVVSSGEFMNKPTAIISASPHPDGGSTALASLTGTLQMMSASIPDQAALSVPFVNRMVGQDGVITDNDTLLLLGNLVEGLLQAVPGR